MNKRSIILIVVASVVFAAIVCSNIFLYKKISSVEGRLWYDDGRIFNTEGGSLGNKYAIKALIANELVDLFNSKKFSLATPCSVIYEYYENVYSAMWSYGGKKWQDNGLRYTDSEMFNGAFKALKSSTNSNYLPGIEKIEQCLLQH